MQYIYRMLQSSRLGTIPSRIQERHDLGYQEGQEYVHIGFGVVITVTMRSTDSLLGVTVCCLAEVHRHFDGTYCLRL